jgi:hypothetical protein
MSTEPFGPDSTQGDNPTNPESSPIEDFLGLGEGLAAGDLPAAFDEETSAAPILNEPSPEEIEFVGEEVDLDMEECSRSLEPLEAIESVEGLANDSFEPQEDYDLETLEENSDGWLMDFEVEEDADGIFGEPALAGEEQDGSEPAYGEDEQELSAEEGAKPWLGRAVIAAVSVFCGVVGAKFLNFGGDEPTGAETQVAQGPQAVQEPVMDADSVEAEPIALETEPAAKIGTATTSETDIAGTDPVVEPVIVTGQEDPGDDQPLIEIDWQEPSTDTGSGGSVPVAPVVAEASPSTEEDLGPRLREASPAELAGVWMDAAIPLDAIHNESRLLTPNVGRVRVVLADGEIFEGSLYAIGEEKVWIETSLGKMALLDWQVDRVEHILTKEGTSALGSDGSGDLRGLKSVRVTTAGGVFYGKLLSQDAGVVTLVTDTGGRITLRGARVDPAGRSASSLVDSRGVIREPKAAPR